MFVRIVWAGKLSSVQQPRGWRTIRHQPRPAGEDLGIPVSDFAKMTKSLFDKPE